MASNTVHIGNSKIEWDSSQNSFIFLNDSGKIANVICNFTDVNADTFTTYGSDTIIDLPIPYISNPVPGPGRSLLIDDPVNFVYNPDTLELKVRRIASTSSTLELRTYDTSNSIVNINTSGVTPGIDTTYDLGSISKKWNDLYVTEIHVIDKAGNETKMSSHNVDDEWEYYSKNVKTGKVLRINMEKMIRKLEEVTGEKFIEEE